MENYYDILKISKTASQDEVKDSYRKLAKEYHPDSNNGNEFKQEKFKKIQEAYEVLSNNQKRWKYDAELKKFESKIHFISLAKVSENIYREKLDANEDVLGATYLPDGYALNAEFGKAYKSICEGVACVLLIGGAGTGKSTFINFIRKNLKNDCGKSCVVLSPTGVSALNVHGKTIHSFFHFPARDFDDYEIDNITKNPLSDKVDLIIIDEISQVESVMLDHIDYALRKWRMSDLPFGGIQMFLTGDPFQLSPWIKLGSEKERFLKAKGLKSQFFFDAHVFDRVDVAPIVLNHIYRQHDQSFIDMLNKIRTAEDERLKKNYSCRVE